VQLFLFFYAPINMKQKIVFIAAIFYLIIITSAFRCGSGNYNDCSGYAKDTIVMPLNYTTNITSIKVGDTINIFSSINDSTTSTGGKTFVTDRSPLFINIQPYKVVANNGGYILNYANIEFNPVINIGQFQNNGSTGYNFVFNRQQPYNKLQVLFVAGKPGLYCFVNGYNNNSYSNYNGEYSFYNVKDNCTNYNGITTLPEANQNKKYWDTLKTSVLGLTALAPTIKKDNKNYFFIKVNP
jgi:hypothetical protein